MKQMISIAILSLAFCFAAFAQAKENFCQKIIINAPESIEMEETLKVSASFEKETQPLTSRFNWTIILGNDVSKINDRGIVEIDFKQSKDSDSIIVLAESPNGECKNTAMAKVFVVPRCGWLIQLTNIRNFLGMMKKRV